MPQAFWQSKTLEELSQDEWESLCDHCGLCCLVRLEDEDTGDIYETSVICRHYDCDNNRCQSYQHRTGFDDGCIQLTPSLVREFNWLPDSCAYRTVMRGDPLPQTHPLLSGSDAFTPKVTTIFSGAGLQKNTPDIDHQQYIVIRDEHGAMHDDGYGDERGYGEEQEQEQGEKQGGNG